MRAGRREGERGRGAPAAGEAAGEVHPPRHPTDAGAPHPPPPPPPGPPLQHPPRRRRTRPPPTPTTPAPASPPRTESGAGADGLGGGGGRGAAPAPQGEPARGAGGARPWDRDWATVPDPLGEEALPLVGEVYGWLSWANQGTTRGMRNRPFDALLLRRDGGNREVPLGGWAAPENDERVLRSVIWAAWPDRGPTWPAFLEGGAVLRITDADANNWLPRAMRKALTHWRYPQPSHKRRRRWQPRRRTRESEEGSWAPLPTPPPRYGVTEERAPPPAGGRAETTSAGGNLLPRSRLTADR